jgi:hypothetical protein
MTRGLSDMCLFHAYFTLKKREIRQMADMARQTVFEAGGRGMNGRESRRRMTTLGSEQQVQNTEREPTGARTSLFEFRGTTR